MKTFKQFIKEDLRRAALVGGTTIGASALTGSLSGLGTIPGAAIGAAYYALSGELKKDLKKKPGDWDYSKKKKIKEDAINTFLIGGALAAAAAGGVSEILRQKWNQRLQRKADEKYLKRQEKKNAKQRNRRKQIPTAR